MVHRKPVQGSIVKPTAPTIPAPTRLPPQPPVPSSFDTCKGNLDPEPDADSDSDFDWDACDEVEEEEEQSVNPSKATPPQSANRTVSASTFGAQIQPIRADEPQLLPAEVSPHGAAANLRGSGLIPQPANQVPIRNTNPFLRKDPVKPAGQDYESHSRVWDDAIPPRQDASNARSDVGLALDGQQSSSLHDTSTSSRKEVTGNAQIPTIESSVVSSGPLVDFGRQEASGQNDNIAPSVPTAEHRKLDTKAAQKSASPVIDLTPTQADVKKQRNEFYQIKHIRWFDGNSKEKGPRQSPILIQNANGPCPLLALVNCLVLSTPASLETALVEALRTREQVSLGLLLDAVFDELTSERRCSSASNLPDVAELYSFLITLHTGMNVNPRFVPSTNLKKVPSAAGEVIPGSFEETREVSLYGAFSIPLIHGWLPHRNESAYGAFERTAQTYEDAQNVQFREEELEQNLLASQLSPEDQQVLNDLKTIKQYLAYWPTQLSAYGLDVVDRFLKPGSLCILFRNDHFSTVLKEPRSNRLMTLVTDAGYATHDEIVWESLVDIHGADSEFCSGDFRSVSHHGEAGSSTDLQGFEEDGWTTVEKRGGRSQRPGAAEKGAGKQPPSPQKAKAATSSGSSIWAENTPNPEESGGSDLPERSQRTRTTSEQEDHDLALALQLQEEEEERQRTEAARRRARENDLSEEYLSRESARQGPVRIPVRRSGQSQAAPTPNANSNTTSAPATNSSGNDVAPPTYEQAAADRVFHPPQNHPSNEYAPRAGLTSSTQTVPAYGVVSGQSPRPTAGTAGQRRHSARQSLYDQSLTDPGLGPGRRGRADPTMLNSSHVERDSGERCLTM